MEPYAWQKACLDKWKENEYRGIAHVVTGAGKTILALYAIRMLEQEVSHPLRVRVVVPTCSLASQWKKAMEEHLSDAAPDAAPEANIPGIQGGGKKDSPNRKYMIYVINSARYQLAAQILSDWKEGYAVLLIADECHHYTSPENRKIFEFLPYRRKDIDAYFSLGLSATIQESGYDSILLPALGREIFRYGFNQAVAEENVSSFSVYQICLSFTADEQLAYNEYSVKLWTLQKKLQQKYPALRSANRGQYFAILGNIAKLEGEDSDAALFLNLSYLRQQLNYMAGARGLCAVSLVSRIGSREKIIIFCERICQLEQVYQVLDQAFPSQTARYHSEMEASGRKQALRRFKEGSCRILITCRALDEGMDVPDASIGIILSGTGANRQRIQRLGRILRRSADKLSACMYYFYVGESAEDSAFLSDTEDYFPVCSLSYYTKEQDFSHPAYESIAAGILEEAKEQGIDADYQKELRRCLIEGLVRPDWLLTQEQLAVKAEAADKQAERNYWICMRRMAKERVERKPR